MNAQNDGGPAFPYRATIKNLSYKDDFIQHGMSLRDWFAGRAVTGLCGMLTPEIVAEIVNNKGAKALTEGIVVQAWSIADAMLATRSKPMP